MRTNACLGRSPRLPSRTRLSRIARAARPNRSGPKTHRTRTPSRDRAYLAYRVEVQRPPAEAPARLLAALPLMKRVAARPFAQLRGDPIRGYDFGIGPAGAVPACVSAGDAADRHAVDCSAEITFPGGASLQRQPVQCGEILGVDQRPMHLLA